MGRHRQPDLHHPGTTAAYGDTHHPAPTGLVGDRAREAEPGGAFTYGGHEPEPRPRAEWVPTGYSYDPGFSYDPLEQDGDPYGGAPEGAGYRYESAPELEDEPFDPSGRHRADLIAGRSIAADPIVPPPAPAAAGFEHEPLYASLASRYPSAGVLPDPAHGYGEPGPPEPAPAGDEQSLSFSGPRFDPLPRSQPPAVEDTSTQWSLEPVPFDAVPAPQAWSFDRPATLTRTSEAETESPWRHGSGAAGRHRAEPGSLGRHRGDRRADQRGIAHSMSGRAVFATAVATALTAGGVGAAATLPSDHSDTAAPQHTAQAVTTRNTAETTLADTASMAGSRTTGGNRIAVQVATSAPTAAPRAFSSGKKKSAPAATPATSARAVKAGPAAKRAGAAGSRTSLTSVASTAPASTPTALSALATAIPQLKVKVTPQWVRPGTGYISSGYGPRWGTFHYGIDLAAPYGSPIYSAGDGLVLRTGPATGFGEAIYIQHANGDTTVYGHEETTLVSPGEHVKAGQLIARVGAEGEATGPHLHFEVHQGSEYGPRIDPGPWLAERGVKL